MLDREIELQEIARCVRKLKNNKTGGSDGLVGELLKYGGSGMIHLLHKLFEVVWSEELVPPKWREGLIVNLFKKGDREDPGNYRGITLLSVVNPRRACARVTLCVCVYLSVPALAASASIGTSKQRYSRVSLRLFLDPYICVEFRKNLPFKSYGVKKPICK